MTKLYWPTTGLFCLALGFSSVMHGFQISPMLEEMVKLGYPPYFMSILGAAKFLGVVALLAPAWPLLKEWAYAGFTFNLLGATGTHVVVGDPFSEMLGPIVLLAVLVVSYLTRPAERHVVGTASLLA